MTHSLASPGCYDFPQYWDLAFRSETKLEADFFEAAFAKYCDRQVRRVAEPGCGGGRLVIEMARRGYDVTAYDLNSACVRYVKQRIRRAGLSATLFVGDMTTEQIRPAVDAAFCTFNTFRHLTTAADARSHLKSMAASICKGGIYILGFHLLPPDADEECTERWTAKHGRTHVTTTLRVLDFDRRKRIEKIRFSLRVRSGERDLKIRSEYAYRIYNATQFRRLLGSVPEFELREVFDFWYDIEEPQSFDNQLGDALFILQRV